MSANYGTPEIFPGSLGGAGGNVTVSPPAGLATGDGWLLLCFADSDPGVTISATGFTGASAALVNDNAVGYPTYRALGKIAGSSESSVNVAFGSGAYDVQVVSIRLTGVRAAGFIGNVTTVTSDTQDTDTPSYSVPAVTVQADGSLVINIVTFHPDGGWSYAINSTPTGVTKIGSRGETYGGGQYPGWLIGAAAANTGSYAPSGSWSLTNNVGNHHKNAVKQTIEIRPTEAAGALAGAATGGASASADLSVAGARQFSMTLYEADGVTLAANKTGLWWSWWDTIAHVRTAAPNASGTGASTDAAGVFTVTAPGGLSVGNDQGFGVISNQDATADTAELAYVGSFDVT